MSLRSHQNSTFINKLCAITFSTPQLVEKAADVYFLQLNQEFACLCPVSDIALFVFDETEAAKAERSAQFF